VTDEQRHRWAVAVFLAAFAAAVVPPPVDPKKRPPSTSIDGRPEKEKANEGKERNTKPSA
jgi:hypothetical protein